MNPNPLEALEAERTAATTRLSNAEQAVNDLTARARGGEPVAASDMLEARTSHELAVIAYDGVSARLRDAQAAAQADAERSRAAALQSALDNARATTGHAVAKARAAADQLLAAARAEQAAVDAIEHALDKRVGPSDVVADALSAGIWPALDKAQRDRGVRHRFSHSRSWSQLGHASERTDKRYSRASG